ncbi:MAG TPA: glycosyltransferase [Candidatus Caenarcaniphilales bacterium]|nr:glycosyltransferase [Candidatus Caenarcaniphilales bacterium]
MSENRRVSVLTPVHRPVARWLLQLHASLDAQHGVEWEWIVQVDGDASLRDEIPEAIREDHRVAVEANGRWLGQSITRNRAVLRGDGAERPDGHHGGSPAL